MTEVTKEQIDGLRELAEALTGKKLGNVKDPVKLQAMIDIARAEAADTDKEAKPSRSTREAKRREAAKEAHKLVRVIVTPMAPFNKQLPGQVFTAGNAVVGNVTRYVHFNEEWHIEAILLKMLKNKRYRTKVEKKDPMTRRTVYENKFYSAFGIQELPALTEEELNTLAETQRARGTVE